MQVSVRKAIRISAAHHIPNHPGKCARPHGHNYLVEVWATGDVDPETGMVKDFYDIGHDLEVVVGHYDHQDLNEMLVDQPTWKHTHYEFTTAENLAMFWLIQLRVYSDKYDRIRVWETDDSYAEASW